jgi:hypothetical protein
MNNILHRHKITSKNGWSGVDNDRLSRPQLVAAAARAWSVNTIRALLSDLRLWDLSCRRSGVQTGHATARTVAAYVRALSLLRNTQEFATHSGVPKRPIGIMLDHATKSIAIRARPHFLERPFPVAGINSSHIEAINKNIIAGERGVELPHSFSAMPIS